MRILKALLVVALFWSCASTVPRKRVHSAATMPRFIHADKSAFGRDAKGGDMALGYQYAPAYTDLGTVHGGNAYALTGALRIQPLTIGFTPFLFRSQVSVEGRSTLGIFTYVGLPLIRGDTWHVSTQASYAASAKTTIEKGCENPDEYAIGAGCVAQPNSESRAEVRIREYGIALLLERKLSANTGFLLAPGAYYQVIRAANRLDSNPSADLGVKTSSWSPSLQAGFRFALGSSSSLAVLGAIHSVKSFAPAQVRRRYYPGVGAQVQF